MAADNLKLQVLLSAIDRVSGPLKKIMGGTSAAAKGLRETQGALKKLNAAQRNIDGFRQLKQGTRDTGAALEEAKRRLHALSAETRVGETVSRKLAMQHRAAGREVQQLTQKHGQQQTRLNALRRTLEQAGYSTTNLARHERTLKADIVKASNAIDQQKSKLWKLHQAQEKMRKAHAAGMKVAAHGAGAVVAGRAAARVVAAPVGAYADQEDAAMQLRASMMAAGGKVGPEFAKIDALAQKLGNRLPGTTAEFYDMMTMLRRQGMSSQSILGGLGESTAYLGVQLKLGYVEAAEFSAKLQDATRTTEADMMGLSDVIQRTFYLGVDSDNMLQGFSKMSSSLDVLRISGLGAAKMFAPLLVMADQAGMKGETAGNAYRKIFAGSMDAKKVDKANSLIKPSGIKLDFTDGKGEFGGLEKMYAQLDKLKGLNTQDRLAVIKKLFGDDAETQQAVALLIDKGAAGYELVQKKMDAQASLQERVNSQLGTLRNLWDAASGTFVNGLAAMGEAVAPELKTLTEWLGKVAEGFQIWAKENPGLSGGLLKVAAALTGIVLVAGGLALALGALLMPFAGLNFALTTLGVNTAPALTKMRELGGKVLTGVGNAAKVAARGIATLVTRLATLAFSAAKSAASAIARLSIKLWAMALGGAKSAATGIASLSVKLFALALGGARAAATAIATLTIKLLVMAWTALPAIAVALRAVGAALIANPIGIVLMLIAGLAYLIWKNWDTIGPKLAAVWAAVSAAVSVAWEWIKAKAAALWENLKTIFAWTPLGMIVTNWGAIMGFLGGLWTKFKDIGANLLQGLVDGLLGGLAKVKETIVGVGSKVTGWFKEKLGINSPSRVFAQFGDYTMAGLAGGLDRSQGLPLRSLTAIAGNMRKLGAGIAIGATALPAMASPLAALPAVRIDSRAPIAPRAAASQVAGATYHITINAPAGGQAQDIAHLVRLELERIDRERAAKTRSRLGDYD